MVTPKNQDSAGTSAEIPPKGERTDMSEPTVMPPIGQDQKYCSECGKIILRRAEICPGCGCRQIFAATPSIFGGGAFRPNPSAEVQGPFVGRMIVLILLNVLWSGVGNLAVGDKRGWGFVFINIVVFALSFFTLFVPCLLFFAYCCYAGYQYLIGIEAAGADRP